MLAITLSRTESDQSLIAELAMPSYAAPGFAPYQGKFVRNLITAVAAVLGLCASVATAAERDISFSVVNKTGATLKALFGGPSSSSDWGDNVLGEKVESGESVVVTVTGTRTCKYDFRFELVGKEAYEEHAINICKIDGQQFEIY